MKLSAVIITFNEERNIGRCLSSLKDVADEIVVVDSFSKDSTKQICLGHGARFIENPFEGHIQQKNVAIDVAKGDYILSLDADEALTPELEKSIRTVKESSDPKDGYTMNRLTNYCGKWIHHCGWYPDTKVRLIRKGAGKWTGVNPHDRLDLFPGNSEGHLEGDLLHYSYYTAEDHLKQIEFFGKIAAAELKEQGRRTNWLEIGLKWLAQLFKSLVIKSAWKDGKMGIIVAWRSAYATYRKYRILLETQ